MSPLDQLQALKGQFGEGAARRVERLLNHLPPIRGQDALSRLHEILLFLRAYPASPRIVRQADSILAGFALRIDDAAAFTAPEISGIAGTLFAAVFSHEVARRLAKRHGRAITADWDGYEFPDSFGAALAKRLPLFAEDWPIEANVPYRAWLGSRGLRWLTTHLTAAEYDALRLPVLWRLGSSTATRSRSRWPARIFYHDGPLLRRSDVSLDTEMSVPPLPIAKCSARQAGRLLDLILDTSAVRYRELYGFTWPDRRHILWAEAGRGVRICFFGVPPGRRLPLRAYHCGMFFKNGVPIGYFETLSLFERAEVGFNLYYTFRDGETAWLYARLLRLLRQWLGVTAFSVDPYQVGLDNDEAIESGAFWFYRKMGFRPLAAEVARLTEREETRLRATPGYRTPLPVLRRMARGGLIYNGGPEWDRFSVRNLGLRLSPRGDGPAGWKQVFAAIADFEHWPHAERRAAAEIARAREGPTEVRYLKLLQRFARLRAAVLKLGS